MSQPGKDLSTVAGIRGLLDTNRYDFMGVAPKHVDAEAFVGLALAMVRRDKYLQEAIAVNSMSFIHALRECAALGHLPMKGIVALTAFNDKNAIGGKSIVLIEQYQGVIERMYRAGGVQSVHVEVGRENDAVLRFNRTRDKLPVHEYDEFASPEERGPLKAVYAWAVQLDGSLSYVSWLNRHAVARSRAASASVRFAKPHNPGGNFWGPEWPKEGPNTEAMWKKTALHRLEAYVPTSAEYRWQLARAQHAGPLSASVGPAVVEPYAEYEEGEIVDQGPPEPATGTGAGGSPGRDWPQVAQPPDAGKP